MAANDTSPIVNKAVRQLTATGAFLREMATVNIINKSQHIYDSLQSRVKNALRDIYHANEQQRIYDTRQLDETTKFNTRVRPDADIIATQRVNDVTNEIRTLLNKSQVEVYEVHIANANDRINDQLKLDNDKLIAQLKAMSAELEKANKKINDLQNQILRLTKYIEALNKYIQTEIIKASGLDYAINRMHDELEYLKQEIKKESNSDDLITLETRGAYIQNAYDQLIALRDRMPNNKYTSDVANNIADSIHEILITRYKLEMAMQTEIRASWVKARKDLLEFTRGNMTHLEKELEIAKKQIEQNNIDALANITKMNKLDTENDNIREKLKQKSQEYQSKLDKKNEEFQNELMAIKSNSDREIDRLTNQIKDLETQILAKTSLTVSDVKVIDRSDLNEKNDELLKVNEELRQELAKQATAMTELTTTHTTHLTDLNNKHTTEIKELNDKLNRLDEQNIPALIKIDSAEANDAKQNKEFIDKIESVTSELNNIIVSLDGNRNTVAINKLNELLKTIDDIGNTAPIINNLNTLIKTIVIQLSKLRATPVDIVKDEPTMPPIDNSKLRELEVKIDSLTDEKEKLAKEMSIIQENNNKLVGDIQTLNNELTETKQQNITELEQRLAELERRLNSQSNYDKNSNYSTKRDSNIGESDSSQIESNRPGGMQTSVKDGKKGGYDLASNTLIAATGSLFWWGIGGLLIFSLLLIIYFLGKEIYTNQFKTEIYKDCIVDTKY